VRIFSEFFVSICIRKWREIADRGWTVFDQSPPSPTGSTNHRPGNGVFLALPFLLISLPPGPARVAFYHLGASRRAKIWSMHWPANRRAGDRRWQAPPAWVARGPMPRAPGERRPAHWFMSPSHRLAPHADRRRTSGPSTAPSVALAGACTARGWAS
jgi:hypothetical protein